MGIRITRLSEEQRPGEGLRIGAVQRPPRGRARGAMYELWLPELAPSAELRLAFRHGLGFSMHEFLRRFRAEMRALERKHLIRFVADLSRTVDLSVGCYCPDEDRCHRSVLRGLLEKAGAEVVERVHDDDFDDEDVGDDGF